MERQGQRDHLGRPTSRQQTGGYNPRYDPEQYPQQSQGVSYPLGPPSTQRPDSSGYGYRGQSSQYGSQYTGSSMQYGGGSFGSDPRAQQLQYTGLMPSGMQPGMGYGMSQTQSYDAAQFGGQRPQTNIGPSNPSYQYPSQISHYQQYQEFMPSVPTQPQAPEFQYGSPPQFVRRDQPTGYAQPSIDYSSQQTQYFPVPQQPLPAQPAEIEERRPNHAYSDYLRYLRQAFELTAQGQLATAGPRLIDASEQLLGRIEELGLHEDNRDRQWQRYDMWKDFNHCWLAFMQRLKEMLQQALSSSQLPVPPLTIIDADYLETMGDKLVSWADHIENYGLVDYEQGVWEEEILDKCRRLFATQPDLFADNQQQQQAQQQPQQQQQQQQQQQPP